MGKRSGLAPADGASPAWESRGICKTWRRCSKRGAPSVAVLDARDTTAHYPCPTASAAARRGGGFLVLLPPQPHARNRRKSRNPYHLFQPVAARAEQVISGNRRRPRPASTGSALHLALAQVRMGRGPTRRGSDFGRCLACFRRTRREPAAMKTSIAVLALLAVQSIPARAEDPFVVLQ